MLVADNPLLNILIPKDNKALKTVLKEADTKTLQQMPQNKSSSASEVLKNLFDQVKSGGKSNSTIENMIKNSSLFKDLGSFSKSTTTLLNQIDSNSNLAKFKPLLENFLKDIKNLDANSLKEQLGKSGVFLESKIAQNTQKGTTLNAGLDKLLNQIQNIIKDVNSPQSKQISDLITKLVEPNSQTSNTNQVSNMKSLVSLLQNLSTSLADKGTQNLSNLTNQLNSLVNKGSLIESKIQNTQVQNSLVLESKNTLSIQTKDLLVQIKNEVLSNNPQNQTKNLLSQIDSLINSNDLFAKNDKLIEPKALLNQLINSNDIKNAANTNSNISTLVLNLKNIANEITNLEQKVLNSQTIVNDKSSLIDNLKQNLGQLKTELSNLPNIDNKTLNQVISKLENIQTLFTKLENPVSNLQTNIANNISTFTNNFTSNLSTLLMSLKEDITNLSSNQNNSNIQNNLLKVIDKIENILRENIATVNLGQNPAKNETSQISNDMKSVLLQMQDDLASKTDAKSQEMFKQVDKMLTQIDYHQLLSHTGNSNNVYVPFLWDMLEDGSINMKKVDEEKFYCQINLTLKDFGKVDLMLAMYDKNKIDLTIHAQREHFKVAVKDNLKNLKKALNDVDLIPVNIKLLDLKEESEKTQVEKRTDAFVNPYNNQNTTSVDIRA
ncbi:MAG: flagellar hook-length control protein FliK [Arcobacter sp.]|nr:flagellar hook-length control protein FliK [Arcobacter sp.]|tara:strand:+ start:3265 stop:5256 length:1992 start_codon:yes stop_codon:yes gene_type:complete